MKPTAKYVDECLDIVQLQHAKAVLTPLTEQKSLNLHDETTACDQIQHSLFRAVVGKLQYITGVRPDLMFATKCLSYKLASPTLADLTRAKKVLKYSTSLIHCIASVGNCEQVHTSVLNLIFQQAKVAGVGNLSKWRSEICSRCWSAP